MAPKIDVDRVLARKLKKEKDYADDPEILRIEKSVDIRLIDTFRKRAITGSGFELESDEAIGVGGEGKAAQPTEFLLMSLGFCHMSILTSCAVSMRLAIDDIEIKVTGHRDNRGLHGDPTVRPGYYVIHMTTVLTSNEPADRIAKLVRVAEGRCPVLDNLTRPTPVTHSAFHGDVPIENCDE